MMSNRFSAKALKDAKEWLQSVIDEAPQEELQLFLNDKAADLIRYHNTLGKDIRNERLWAHEYLANGTCEIGGHHVDDISMKAIEEVHAENQDKRLDGYE